MLLPLEGLLISLFSTLLFGITFFLVAVSSKKAGALSSMFLFQLIGIPFFIFLLPFNSVPLTDAQFGPIFLTGFIYTFFFLLVLYTYKVGEVSVVAPIIDSYLVVTALLAILFLGDSLTGFKVLGIMGVTLGVIALSFDPKVLLRRNQVELRTGILPAVISAISIGVYLFFVALLIEMSGWFYTSVGMRIALTLTAGGILLYKKITWQQLIKGIDWRIISFAAVFDVLAFSLYNFAVSRYETSYVTTITAAQTAVIVLLGAIFLKEKITPIKVFGLSVIIFGIGLLQLG